MGSQVAAEFTKAEAKAQELAYIHLHANDVVSSLLFGNSPFARKYTF